MGCPLYVMWCTIVFLPLDLTYLVGVRLIYLLVILIVYYFLYDSSTLVNLCLGWFLV